MNLINWLADKLGKKSIPISGNMDLLDEYAAAAGETHIRELAFWSAVNLISNAVSKCEFRTFAGNEEIQGDEYYLWNIEPNKNQNSSEFIHKWIAQLYRKNECLIIVQEGQLLVADSFIIKKYAYNENEFTQVSVGDTVFEKIFRQSEVLYWQLNANDMRSLMNGLYNCYSKLISYSMTAFQRSRGTKGIFKYETLPVAGSQDEVVFNNLIKGKFRDWLLSDNSVLPLGKGQEWIGLDRKAYQSDSSRDIRALADDIFDFTAKATGIPPALLKGNVEGTKDAVENLLTFCVDPLCNMLQKEINRKRIGKRLFLQGYHLQIDTKTIKHIDLFSIANSADKLISSGILSINDIRKYCGETEINEDWANEHLITRNYMPFEDALSAMRGGNETE